MPSKLGLLICAVAFLGSIWSTSVSAGHLKGKTHHHQKTHRMHHHKAYWPSYFKSNYDDVYAICVFHHPEKSFLLFTKKESFSVGFFDQQGELLPNGVVCDQSEDVGLSFIQAVVTARGGNADDWKEDVVDDKSKCFLHKDEEEGAQPLMVSYSCDDVDEHAAQPINE